jgi:hypothetical protein
MEQWFMRRKYLNDPTYFCTFVIIPLEEDLALYLNNSEFKLPKDDLYQV